MTKVALSAAEKAGVTISVSDYYNSDALNKDRIKIIGRVESYNRFIRMGA